MDPNSIQHTASAVFKLCTINLPQLSTFDFWPDNSFFLIIIPENCLSFIVDNLQLAEKKLEESDYTWDNIVKCVCIIYVAKKSWPSILGTIMPQKHMYSHFFFKFKEEKLITHREVYVAKSGKHSWKSGSGLKIHLCHNSFFLQLFVHRWNAE